MTQAHVQGIILNMNTEESRILSGYEGKVETRWSRYYKNKLAELEQATEVELYYQTRECLKILKENELGVELIEEKEEGEVSVGYVLPLSQDNNQHLVVFSNGAMLVIEPFDTKESTVTSYQECFSPDTRDPLVKKEYDESFEEALSTKDYYSKVVQKNNTHNDKIQFTRYIFEALTTAQEMKLARERQAREQLDARSSNMSSLSAQLNQMYPKPKRKKK